MLEMEPVLASPPTTPFTFQTTPVFLVPSTFAVNCCVCPAERFAAAGDTLTETAGRATVMPRAFVASAPTESCACTVKPYEPAVDGVPAKVPALARVTSGGRSPETTDQEYGAPPPVAESVAL